MNRLLQRFVADDKPQGDGADWASQRAQEAHQTAPAAPPPPPAAMLHDIPLSSSTGTKYDTVDLFDDGKSSSFPPPPPPGAENTEPEPQPKDEQQQPAYDVHYDQQAYDQQHQGQDQHYYEGQEEYQQQYGNEYGYYQQYDQQYDQQYYDQQQYYGEGQYADGQYQYSAEEYQYYQAQNGEYANGYAQEGYSQEYSQAQDESFAAHEGGADGLFQSQAEHVSSGSPFGELPPHAAQPTAEDAAVQQPQEADHSTSNSSPFEHQAVDHPFAQSHNDDPFAQPSTQEQSTPSSQELFTQSSSQGAFAQSSNHDPFASTSSQDPFAQTSSHDPFAQTSSQDPFAQTSSQDPFAPTTNQEPFGQTSSQGPFAQPSSHSQAHFSPPSSQELFAESLHQHHFGQPASEDPFAQSSPHDQFSASSTRSSHDQIFGSNTPYQSSSGHQSEDAHRHHECPQESEDTTFFGQSSGINPFAQPSNHVSHETSPTHEPFGQVTSTQKLFSQPSDTAPFGQPVEDQFSVAPHNAFNTATFDIPTHDGAAQPSSSTGKLSHTGLYAHTNPSEDPFSRQSDHLTASSMPQYEGMPSSEPTSHDRTRTDSPVQVQDFHSNGSPAENMTEAASSLFSSSTSKQTSPNQANAEAPMKAQQRSASLGVNELTKTVDALTIGKSSRSSIHRVVEEEPEKRKSRSTSSTLDDTIRLAEMYKSMTERLEAEKSDLLKVLADQTDQFYQMQEYIHSLERELAEYRAKNIDHGRH